MSPGPRYQVVVSQSFDAASMTFRWDAPPPQPYTGTLPSGFYRQSTSLGGPEETVLIGTLDEVRAMAEEVLTLARAVTAGLMQQWQTQIMDSATLTAVPPIPPTAEPAPEQCGNCGAQFDSCNPMTDGGRDYVVCRDCARSMPPPLTDDDQRLIDELLDIWQRHESTGDNWFEPDAPIRCRCGTYTRDFAAHQWDSIRWSGLRVTELPGREQW